MLKHRTALIILLIAAALLLSACTKTQPPDTAEPPPPEETAAPAQAGDELPTDSVTKPTPLPEDPALMPEDDEPALPAPITDENGFVWRVPPTLEYDSILRCICGRFVRYDNDEDIINKVTGLINEYEHDGHGPYGTYSNYYDGIKNLYGYTYHEYETDFEMWPADEFLDNNEWAANRLNEFRKIDSGKVIKIDDWEVGYDVSEAIKSEKYALTYGITFVTDFVYDDYAYSRNVKNYIAVQLDGKWGVVDKDGNTAVPFDFDVIILIDDETAFAKYENNFGIIGKEGHTAVPFCFEDILLIDDETAFAKYNGKYGILDITATMENTRNP
jgi:hypothetical protein